MKPKFRFSLRVLLILIVIAAIPCWWAGSKTAQYSSEQAALKRIREIAPDLHVAYTTTTPRWLRNLGLQPAWLERVTDIDVTGTTGGRDITGCKLPLAFDDNALAAILEDLHRFERLNELYFQLTELTDASLPKLQEFKNVRFINLQQTAATSNAVKELEANLPNTTIAFFHD